MRVAVVYAAVAAVWILFSDTILAAFAPSADVAGGLSMIKGWLFVVVTASLLYLERRRGETVVLADRAALEASEARYKSLFETDHVVMLVLDPGTARIVDANPAAAQFYGCSREALLEAALTKVSLSTPEVIEAWFAGILATGGGLVERRHRRGDGQVRDVEVYSGVITLEGRRLVYAILHDVTERLQAERALREAEARGRAVLAALPDICFRLDASGRVLDHNAPAGSAVDGAPSLAGRTAAEILPPELGAAAEQTLARTLSTRAPQELGFELPGPAGLRSFEARVAPLGEQEVLAVVRDVSARKGLEEQLRQAAKMEAIGKLAGGIAHDFNNLLGAILGYGELVREALEPGDPRHDDLREVLAAGERAAALTGQLLAFSRRQPVTPRRVDLVAALRETEGMLRRLVGEDVELRLELAVPSAPVLADLGQIHQVLLNLVVNARDAMPTGGTLELRLDLVTLGAEAPAELSGLAPGRFVELRVADSGLGMDPATLARVFEPFFTTKAVGEGTGLGLATTYAAVQQSGGAIRVESAPGRGTVFQVLLPCHEAAAEAPEPEEGGQAAGGDETILLVEDEAALRELAERVLSAAGYRVVAAGSLEAALEAAAALPAPPELLLTDVVMPGGSGRELTEALRGRCPSLAVLYMTGYTDEAIERHGVERGRTGLLTKPIRAAELLLAVRAALDARAGSKARPVA